MSGPGDDHPARPGVPGRAGFVPSPLSAADRGRVNGALYLAFYLGSGVPAVVIGLPAFALPLAGAVTVLSAVTAVLVVGTIALPVVVDRRVTPPHCPAPEPVHR
ncbi:hypothetical protein [Corynebacterium halotolerans]|uniref:hypothetical protein n=1 Tax=Corynebacterium halotolerans TaxID=225326 RepID=UPI000AE34E3A|nr:hypothetical protein [Corynebacterium halotolerans]